MDNLLFIVKIFALFQLSLIVILLFFFFITNGVLAFQRKRTAVKVTLFTKLIGNALKNKTLFDNNELNKLKANSLELTTYLTTYKEEYASYEYYPQIINQLVHEVFLPLGRDLAYSTKWFKRYTAALAYSYGFEAQDEEKLLHLVKDKSLLIALNAATTLMSAPNYNTVSSIIDIFAKGRRLQQSVYSELLIKAQNDISVFVIKKLTNETDTYTKVFCYRLLARLPNQLTINEVAKHDLLTASKDLKIAVIYYINNTQDKQKEALILAIAHRPDLDWELKATLAKVLGAYSSKESIAVLKQLLYDAQWWVRLNAVRSLSKRGEKGISILRQESQHMDKELFKITQSILKTQAMES